MSNKKQVYYNLDNIDKKGSSINIIWGERSNGKSFQVKHKRGINKIYNNIINYFDNYKKPGEIIERVLEKGTKFIYLRRWKEEISTFTIEQYFNDVDIEKISDGKYNCVELYRKKIYLSNYDVETGKTKKGIIIGYACALSTEQNYASLSFLDVTDIIFEEFMSRSGYIKDEPTKLMNFYSTIDRKRGTTKVWLIGNTITKVNPYLIDWGLLDIVSKQKQGDINSLWVSTGTFDDEGIEIKVKIAIEYCRDSKTSSFIIGKHKDMLNKGSWQTDPQPHLPKSLKEYKSVFVCGFMYKSFKFIGRLLFDKNSKVLVWFIQPYKKEFKEKLIIFSDIVKTSEYYQRDIYNVTFKNRNKKLYDLFLTFRESNIFYSDDGCGTEFKQSIDFIIRK